MAATLQIGRNIFRKGMYLLSRARVNDWILFTRFWDDQGKWDDTETWKD